MGYKTYTLEAGVSKNIPVLENRMLDGLLEARRTCPGFHKETGGSRDSQGTTGAHYYQSEL